MLHKMDKDLPTITSHIKRVRIVLEMDHLEDDYQPGRNKLQDHSTSGFRPIKETTQTSIGTLSSQPIEDDDEVEASDNEEDEVGAKKMIPIDEFQTEMRTAFEQLQINQEIQGMQLTEIVESTRHYAGELADQKASIDRQEVMLARLCKEFMPDQGQCKFKLGVGVFLFF
ncbi:hypothetical protein M9H77_29704 [Catharanthus roseus]|uniref:Uncharacterized protein n=1 Tax=Catharanthus roseus TaxID=4058 RepID=A0ACB9ZXS1_CATRO|nr:hypothetical protein M9H77_29704 [Catharanthus roseus]